MKFIIFLMHVTAWYFMDDLLYIIGIIKDNFWIFLLKSTIIS